VRVEPVTGRGSTTSVGSQDPTTTDELEAVDPSTVVQMYIRDRKNELSQATIYSNRSKLGHFTRWCDQKGIQETRELSPLTDSRYVGVELKR